MAPSVLNPGVLWILEDHLNEPAFYAIDLTGTALGTLSLEGGENVDWEAIAPEPCPTGTDRSPRGRTCPSRMWPASTEAL